jgi:hypothetical protein
MEPTMSELRQLLERQGQIREAMRRPGGIRITVERELFAIGEKLKKYPPAVQAPARELAHGTRRQ